MSISAEDFISRIEATEGDWRVTVAFKSVKPCEMNERTLSSSIMVAFEGNLSNKVWYGEASIFSTLTKLFSTFSPSNQLYLVGMWKGQHLCSRDLKQWR